MVLHSLARMIVFAFVVPILVYFFFSSLFSSLNVLIVSALPIHLLVYLLQHETSFSISTNFHFQSSFASNDRPVISIKINSISRHEIWQSDTYPQAEVSPR